MRLNKFNSLFTKVSINNHGYSLLELLVVSALSTLLLLSVGETYLTVRHTYEFTRALMQFEDESIYANNYLASTIRMAGYAQCDKSIWPVQLASSLQGFHNGLPEALATNQLAANSDAVIIERCANIANHERLLKIALFIADTHRKNNLGLPIYGLFEQAIGSSRVEIIANVDNMHIIYGIGSATSRQITHYLTATQMTAQDWLQVKSIDILLLLKSEEPILPQLESYAFAGNLLPPSKFLYKTLNSYIALRETL